MENIKKSLFTVFMVSALLGGVMTASETTQPNIAVRVVYSLIGMTKSLNQWGDEKINAVGQSIADCIPGNVVLYSKVAGQICFNSLPEKLKPFVTIIDVSEASKTGARLVIKGAALHKLGAFELVKYLANKGISATFWLFNGKPIFFANLNK